GNPATAGTCHASPARGGVEVARSARGVDQGRRARRRRGIAVGRWSAVRGDARPAARDARRGGRVVVRGSPSLPLPAMALSGSGRFATLVWTIPYAIAHGEPARRGFCKSR